MKKSALFFLLMVHTCSFAQKIKDDTEKYLLKTYPAINLPEDVQTYAITVDFSDGSSLSSHKLDPIKLRDKYMQVNALRYDAEKSRLKLEVFVNLQPPKFDLGTITSIANNQPLYSVGITSRIKGNATLTLDGKVIAFKEFDFPLNSSFNNATGLNFPDEYWVADTCGTFAGTQAPTQAALSNWVDYSGPVPVPNYEAVANVDALQMTKLYKVSAWFFKEQVDVVYHHSKCKYYAVKYKEKDMTRIDSADRAILPLMKSITKENYSALQQQVVSLIRIWQQEKNKFNTANEQEKPVVWALLMNTATAANFVNDYALANSAIEEAQSLAYEIKETDKLKNIIDHNNYSRSYKNDGSGRESKINFLSRETGKEEYFRQKSYDDQAKANLIQEQISQDKERNKYIIENQFGTVYFKDGVHQDGHISYDPDKVRYINTTPIHIDVIDLEYMDAKKFMQHKELHPDKVRGFAVDGIGYFESLTITTSSEDKLLKLPDPTGFYKMLQSNEKIYLYKFESHHKVEYAFMLPDEHVAYSTGYGAFHKNPNGSLAELLKASPEVAQQAATVSFTDEALKKICDAYAQSLKSSK